MLKAIFYKEWIKTRWYFLFAILVTTGFAAYSMLRINRVAQFKGVEHVWEVMLQRDVIFIDLLQYVPLLAGILLALVQYIPEMHHKCLKLTLHLPYPQLRMVAAMLFSGAALLFICFLCNFLLMVIYLQSILPYELQKHILLTALTWYIAGFAGYLLVAWICLEPSWKRRIINIAVSVLVLKIFFMSSTPEAYNSFLPWLIIYTILSASLPWLSVSRFKAGKQD